MEESKSTNAKSTNAKVLVVIAAAMVVCSVLIVACDRLDIAIKDSNKGAAAGLGSAAGEKVRLDVYVMSQCPYGVQAENALKDVFDKIGANVDFHLEYIGGGSKGSFNSLHGQNEVNGDIAQLCAAKHSPDKYFDLVLCQNENYQGIPDNWESCANKTGLDVQKIKGCYAGDEGENLLEASFNQSTKAGVQGSPTFKINGEDYNGKRDSKGILSALCNAFSKDKPEECSKIPPPVEVEILILNDKECAACDTSQYELMLKQVFDGAKFNRVDAATEEGKAAISKYGLEKAPSFVFDAKLEDTDAWKTGPQLQEAFVKKQDKWVLRDEATGANFYLEPAKRAGAEKAAAEAKKKALEALGVNNDNKPQIDFFVMSYCPYGNQAEETVKDVWDQLKDKADFNPHYVIYQNYQGGSADFCKGGYCSMHGVQELNQDIRELCVRKNYGIKEWFNFSIAMNYGCDYKNADSCWKPVAEKLNLDTKKIADCEEKEGLDLVKAEYELNSLLGVQGSPTVFIEGQSYEGARTPAGFQAALCDAFKEQPGDCKMTLSSESKGSAAAAGGCGS